MSDDPRIPRQPVGEEPQHFLPRPGGSAMRLQIFGFPLGVSPWFFLTVWAIGGRREPQWLMVWVVVAFVGVLAHELGHAFAGRRLGLQPSIRLFAFGGMTSWGRPRRLKPGQEIFLSAAGPAVGIVVGGAVLLAGYAGLFASAPPAAMRVLNDVLWVNLGWGLLNLLPILPLDGGHIAAAFASIVAGRNGRVVARYISITLTVSICVWAVFTGQWWMAILGGVLTYANVQALRAERFGS